MLKTMDGVRVSFEDAFAFYRAHEGHKALVVADEATGTVAFCCTNEECLRGGATLMELGFKGRTLFEGEGHVDVFALRPGGIQVGMCDACGVHARRAGLKPVDRVPASRVAGGACGECKKPLLDAPAAKGA